MSDPAKYKTKEEVEAYKTNKNLTNRKENNDGRDENKRQILF
jgi:hypothetical protein